ncbi:hypothetical protein VHEMI03450 [[Torrubiella] hemipterigena]|uniref:Uncharacterized protein n=1 Tax=[Torrubiella] hemipterigena TaxID=1531966 RepID=A0A0A1SSJ5_9HYPO|nr:hypothetical protein VHEMI03450 [[Torrubiella] hemipterigena]
MALPLSQSVPRSQPDLDISQANPKITEIGIAVSSPSEMRQYIPAGALQAEITTSITAAPVDESGQGTKQKSKKWGFLTRSISKRLASDSTSSRGRAVTNPSSDLPFHEKVTSQLGRAASMRSRAKPVFGRHQEDLAATGNPYERHSGPPLSPSSRHDYRDLHTRERNSMSSLELFKPLPDTPVLNITIPTMRMERYSVMFSEVLNRAQKEPVTSSHLTLSSSALNTIEEGEGEKMNIERVPQQQQQQSQRVQPMYSRSRANTGSDVMSNESSEYTHEPPRTSQRPTSGTSANSADGRLSSVNGEQRQPLVSKFHRPTRSPDSIWSHTLPTIEKSLDQPKPSSEHSEGDAVQILESSTNSHHSALTGASDTEVRQARSASLRQDYPDLTKPVVKPKVEEQESIYEVAIARQVSISRQQRTMLGPLLGSTSRRGPRSPNQRDAAARIALGTSTLVAENNTSTPTVVRPSAESCGSPDMLPHGERAIIERV